MSGVFISYRREDCAGHAGRLYDRLAEHFGPDRVFMDVDSIEPGVDFSERLDEAVGACSLLIALIGSGWLDARDDAGRRRLDDPEDFVHQELAAALARGGLRVIPVLVEGATMPRAEELPQDLKPLARRNARELSHARWDYDAGRLIEAAQLTAVASSPLRTRRPTGAATVDRPRRILPSPRRLPPVAWRAVALIAVIAAAPVGIVLLSGRGGSPARPAVVTAAIGKSPGRLTVGAGFVWVPLGAEGAVARVDPQTLAVKRITGFTNYPFAASVDADGKIGGIWVTDSGAGEVVRIDPVTSKPGKPIPVTTQPIDIAVGEGFVWTADCNCDAPEATTTFYVSRIDPESHGFKHIDVGARPAGIAVGDGYVWVTSAGSVQTIEPRSGDIVGKPIPVGGVAEDVVVDGRSVWIAVSRSGDVARVDSRTRKVNVRIAVGPEPRTLAIGGGFLWVIDGRDGMLRRMSLRTRSLVGEPLRVDLNGAGVAFGEGRAWATAAHGEGYGAPGTLKGFAP